MTTVDGAHPHARRGVAREEGALVGAGALVRLALRRDRWRLAVWVLGIVGITYFSAAAVAATYNTPALIASYAVNVGNSPAGIALAGPPVALDQIGGILVYETSLTALLGVALMAMLTVVRHTRAEEEAGRTELLASTVVGRHAGALAAVAVAAAGSLLIGAGVWASMLAVGMPGEASLLYGASIAAMGLVFASVAAVTAQLMTNGRGASGFALAVLGMAFLLRAFGDVNENFLSWLSPMGWSQQVRVLEDNRWWPLVLSLAAVTVLLAAAAVLANLRDIGSGIVPPRPGPPGAGPLLSSPFGLAWRLQRGTVLGWAIGAFAFGAMFGSFAEDMQNMVKDNPVLEQYFELTGGSITDSFFAVSLLFIGLAAAGFAVGSVLRLRSEESSGRLESVLAAAVSRWRSMLEALVVTVLGALIVVVTGGTGLAVAFASSGGTLEAAVELAALALIHLPAVLVLAGVAVLLTGWAPRAAALAWLGVAIAFVVGWLGPLLGLPGWLEALSPFHHVPVAPVDPVVAQPLVWLTAVGLLLIAVGAVGFRRRDLTT